MNKRLSKEEVKKKLAVAEIKNPLKSYAEITEVHDFFSEVVEDKYFGKEIPEDILNGLRALRGTLCWVLNHTGDNEPGGVVDDIINDLCVSIESRDILDKFYFYKRKEVENGKIN